MIRLILENRILLWLMIVLVLVAGVSAYLNLPRQEDPRIVNRGPLVITAYPGASAERVESLVTEKLEEAIQDIEEIKDVDSTSRAGISLLAISLVDEIEQGRNREVFSRIRDRLADAVPLLPPGAGEPFLDDKRDTVAFTYISAVVWEGDGEPPRGLMTRVAEDLADELRLLSGTDIVRLYGDVEEEILVELDEARLTALGLEPSDVLGSIARSDAKLPAGLIRLPQSDAPLEVTGALDTVEQIRAIPVRSTREDARLARLGDLADVTRQWNDPAEQAGLVNGRPAIFVAARANEGINVGAWAEEARAIRDQAAHNFGSALRIVEIFDEYDYTASRLGELALNMFLGACVIVAVILLFMGFRASLIVGFALPLSVAAVFFLMVLLDGRIHQMSIFGMIIALGLLIDNAIVVVDEVRKRAEAGETGNEAVLGTVRYLFLPLLASTATTVLAFAPIMLLPGNAGDFVSWIGGSVVLAVVSSFVLSMLVIAPLSGIAGGFSAAGARRFWSHGLQGGAVARLYRRGLRAGLRLPALLVLLAVFPALVGYALAPSLGNQFFPPTDRDMMDIRVWFPEGHPIGETVEEVRRLDALVRETAGVEATYWLAGASFPSVYYNLLMNQDNSPHYAQGAIKTASPAATERLVVELQGLLDREFPGAQVVLREFGQGPPIEADVQYRIIGPDPATLARLGEDLRLQLQRHPDVLHTQASMAFDQRRLWYHIDEDKARALGLRPVDVSERLQARLRGETGGSVLEELSELPVRVRLAEAQRTSLDNIASTWIPGETGAPIPLDAVGEFRLAPTIGGITRHNGERANLIKGYTREGALPINVSRNVLSTALDGKIDVPSGYRIEFGGAVEQDAEATGNLLLYVPVLATLMIAILVAAFRSVKLAILLLAIAPVSGGLALLATWIIQFPISFNTILGTLGLIGVALNDSIVVLSAIRGNRDAAAGDFDAIVDAVADCGSHVLSTTLTTIGGFLPLLLFVGGDFWPSLAIVLCVGVLGATLIALVFVPSMYLLLGAHRDMSNASRG